MFKEFTEGLLQEGEKFITVMNVVEMTGVPKSTVKYHIGQDYMDAYFFRNRWVIRKQDAEKYKQMIDMGLIGRTIKLSVKG